MCIEGCRADSECLLALSPVIRRRCLLCFIEFLKASVLVLLDSRSNTYEHLASGNETMRRSTWRAAHSSYYLRYIHVSYSLTYTNDRS